MTYQVYYLPKNSKENDRGFSMFDIEYYQTRMEGREGWFSEIDCLPIVEGIVKFLKEKRSENNFDYEEFIKDADGIQEIRGLLYERYNNKPRKSNVDAHHFHYRVFGKVLEEMLENFSKKYDLHINRD